MFNTKSLVTFAMQSNLAFPRSQEAKKTHKNGLNIVKRVSFKRGLILPIAQQ